MNDVNAASILALFLMIWQLEELEEEKQTLERCLLSAQSSCERFASKLDTHSRENKSPSNEDQVR